MNLSDYLVPLSSNFIAGPEGEFGQQVIVNRGHLSVDSLNKGDIALVGIPYFMNKELEYTGSSDLVRKELYLLAGYETCNCNIVDTGNLKKGENVRETLYSLKELLDLFREREVFTLLLGGSNIFNLGILMHYETVKGKYAYTIVEPWFSLVDYLPYQMLDFDLLNYYNLGCQLYYLNQAQKKWLETNQYESVRLGKMRGYPEETEPCLRDSDGCSISINAIKNAEAPGQLDSYPNGLYNEEVCQLARYSGLANNLDVFGVFDYYPERDRCGVTAKMIAQVLWFSIEGFLLRYHEHPYADQHFQKFQVSLDDHRITFYKSEQTFRWWMEIPDRKEGFSSYVFPCNHSDYEQASRHEIPERWLKAYQKLNFY
ncbi:MAG: hypothetical protein ACLFM7_00155 [Bacteroidales bacterium]